jgi:selenium metabolism protein YedF
MEPLDLRGKTCPMPVIETKRFLEGTGAKEIQVLVDNPTSCENVKRFLETAGFTVSIEKKGDDFLLSGLREKEAGSAASPAGKKVLVYIDGTTMGRGNDDLGAILMRSFLNTLKELDPKPWRIIFVNTGVYLAVDSSDYINILKEIESLGTEILACGTCLDFFNVKARLAVGKISNMFDIASSFLAATHVIKL